MNQSYFYVKAMEQLIPEAGWRVRNGEIDLSECSTSITTDEIITKANELLSLEPVRLLREQRNQLLQQTDWRMTTDYPYNDQSAWASYRTALRDLPATATPTLDEQGNLIVDWPTAPDAI